LFYKGFGFPGLVPKIGIEGFLLLVRDFYTFAGNVKDTASMHPGDF
jgi:hypothetical protein